MSNENRPSPPLVSGMWGGCVRAGRCLAVVAVGHVVERSHNGSRFGPCVGRFPIEALETLLLALDLPLEARDAHLGEDADLSKHWLYLSTAHVHIAERAGSIELGLE